MTIQNRSIKGSTIVRREMDIKNKSQQVFGPNKR